MGEKERLAKEAHQARNFSARWLAARDSQQRREGAAEKLNEMADGGLNWDAVTLRREAEAVLKEGQK